MERYKLPDDQRALLEGLQQPFAVYQFVDGRVVTLALSDGFCELFGYEDRAEACYDMDHDMYKGTHQDDMERIANAALRFATEGGDYEVVYRSHTKKERHGYRIIHALGKHVYTADGVRLAHIWYTDEGLYTDEDAEGSTALNRAMGNALREESLVRASRYDYLTGMPNMSYFFSLAEAAKDEILREGGCPAMLYMDFSGLKFFNTKYGYGEGDLLLQTFARCLGRTFGGDRCCRIGADHFAAVAKSEALDETLRQMLEEFHTMNDGRTLPVHVGVYSSSSELIHATVALDRARIACNKLRGRYEDIISHYSRTMSDEAERKQHIIENIDRAVAERWIQVCYQPIIRAVNGRISEEEALSRWIDPERGRLSPAEFIPALEEAGLIYKLDLYVLDRILEKINLERESGITVVPHSINLSRSDFDACDMVEEIRTRVDAVGVSRDRINIEITESIIGRDFDFMKQQVERFRELGFPVWMDDFGSGYSSLDVLQSIRFDLVKFDMGFLRRLNEGDRGRIILAELMKLMSAIGVDMVCEGVETAEQAGFLREIGCAKLQGFYFLAALPLEEILERFDRGFQIGFENPQEAAYYDAVGSVNLYDLASVAREGGGAFRGAFSTLPMGIVEVKGKLTRFARSNQSYRDFVRRFLGYDLSVEGSSFVPYNDEFMNNIVQTCVERGVNSFFDERMPDGAVVHSFARRLGVNPLNGTVAVAIAVLSITPPGEGESYADIARALASNYFRVFTVDLDTERFTEFRTVKDREGMTVERHGERFFTEFRRVSQTQMFIEDRAWAMEEYTKENILRDLDGRGVFTISFRKVDGNILRRVNIKITRLNPGGNHCIVLTSIADDAPAPRESGDELQRIVDRQMRPSAVLSVERGPDDRPGMIRIVCANREYKESMGGAFRENMPYYELVPKKLKFENMCYRCAIGNQQIHTYLETQMANTWIDEQLIPLYSDRKDMGYCQIILELSEARDPERMSAVPIQTASGVLKAAITLLGTTDLKDRVGKVLENIMELSEAISVRIILLDHENRRAVNYSECFSFALPADYVPPAEDPDQAVISYKVVCSWEAMLGDGNSLVVTNKEEMDEVALRNPVWVRTLRAYDTTNFILIPLRHDKQIIGYLYLCNFNPDRAAEVTEMAELMSFFLGTEIYNEVLLKRLDEMSHTDALTGLNNRNAMIRRTAQLSESEEPVPFGIVNLDLNGLKLVNDYQGHDAGDRLLISAAETLKRYFYQEDLYRTGGDEFIIISTGITPEAFARKVERLRGAIGKDDKLSFAIGEFWSDGATDIHTAFRIADERMYADKKAFYENHPDQKR